MSKHGFRREFREHIQREVFAYLEERPEGFTAVQFLNRLGYSDEAGKRRVRRQLDGLVEAGVLIKPDWGVYLLTNAAELADTPTLGPNVWQAFRSAGGVLTKEDLMAALPHGIAEQRVVREHLTALPAIYRVGLPRDGLKRHWLVTDELRSRIPLPGNLQLLELRMLKMQAGHLPRSTDIADLDAFRRRVAVGVADARQLRGLSVAEIIAHPALRKAIVSLIHDDATVLDQLPKIDFSTSNTDAVLALLWTMLENAEDSATVQQVLNVECWDAIGAALKLDSGALSRGSHISIQPNTGKILHLFGKF